MNQTTRCRRSTRWRRFAADIPVNPLQQVREALPAVLDELSLSSGEAFTGRRTPGVVFSVVADGVPCLVTYDLGSGSVSSIPPRRAAEDGHDRSDATDALGQHGLTAVGHPLPVINRAFRPSPSTRFWFASRRLTCNSFGKN